MEPRNSYLFWFLGRSFLASLIISLGLAAVLSPEPPQQQRQSRAEGIRDAYVKTSFSCEGRPSGYYADVDTGCELYHMCDTLGRKFSYACPNTTLFQQRMLVCDHWFMVNCSKAEDDYSANLLIGQRDKPFVGADENVERTPRPDLTDRPYSADYSGESFRRHYKHHIKSPDSTGTTDTPEYAAIHWETSNRQAADQQAANNAPTQVIAESQNDGAAVSGLRVFQTPSGFSKPEIIKSVDVTGTVQIPTAIFEIPNQHPEYARTQTPRSVASASTTPTNGNTVSPSAFAKAFEANPHQFKNKEHNDVAKQFKTKDVNIVFPLAPTTLRIIETPATENPSPPPPQPVPTTTQPPPPQTTSTAQTTERTPVADQGGFKRPTSSIPEPIDGLQPPHLHYKTYDDSTTEGPPIYYQWKWAVPAFVLEPPKLNDPETKDEKSPTARSIGEKNTGNAGDDSFKVNPNFFRMSTQQPEHNYNELRKSLSIPSYEFPLEDELNVLGNTNALNSYQLKIPANVQSWYGENERCPQCHPAFLEPGTCEPCVKR